MSKLRFVRIDADNVGDRIELSLLNENYTEAQAIHDAVQNALYRIRLQLEDKQGVTILMFGSDDILFSIEGGYDKLINEIRNNFKEQTANTLSVGVGNSIIEALNNLRRAKYLGRDRIVD